MTLSERLTDQALELDLNRLTPKQHEWLHTINTLFTWAWVAAERRKMEARK